MTIPQISARRDGGNMVATARFGERTAVATHREGSPFDVSIHSLMNSVASVGIAAAAAAERLQLTALVAEIRQGMRVEVRPAFERVVKAVQTQKQHNILRLAKLSENATELPFGPEDRAAFRALPVADKLRWIATADRDQLAAVVGAGRARFPGTNDATWSAATERLQLLNFIALAGQQAEHALKPTADNPAVVGPDVEAAEAWARDQMTQIQSEMAAVGHAERTLRDVIAVVAVSCDMKPDAAHGLLTGQEAA